METATFVKEQNILISIIGYFILLTLLEELFFGLTLKFSPRLLQRSPAILTPFSAIVGKFVFIADGLINKNIYQISAYLILVILVAVMSAFGFIKSGGGGLVFNIITLVVLFIDGSYTLYMIIRLRQKYKWFYYKKLGLLESLQSINRQKQILNVFFKIDLFLTITNFEYPTEITLFPLFGNYFCLFLTILCFFLYSQWHNEENRLVWKILIGVNLVQSGVEIAVFVVLLFQIIYLNIFVIVSLLFSFVNDLLFSYFLYRDMQTFGNNYVKALKQNVRQKRNAIENSNR